MNGGLLLIFGIGVFGGTLGAWLFQRLKIPQVVGYIAIGVLVGETGLRLIRADDIAALNTFNLFALGVIGFLVGGELRGESFRQYGRQYLAVLLGEGLASVALVGVASGAIVYAITGDAPLAIAAGAILGAISSATDPASTVSVLWEYRARGVLTMALIAVVALDDALALVLYGMGASTAHLAVGGAADLAGEARQLLIALVGAPALGAACGFGLSRLLRYSHQQERTLVLALGLLLLVIGAAVLWDMDVILAAMAMGLVLANQAPRRTQDLFQVMRSFSTPIYVMFFVLVGARLQLGDMPGWIWGIVAVYVVGRSLGKYGGAYVGARISGAHRVIRDYCGLGLMAQGGVAIGLSIMATAHLAHIDVVAGVSIGDMVVFVITASTLIVQVLAPPLVKLAIHRAGEVNRDVTEEDILSTLRVIDVMDESGPLVAESEPLRNLVDRFSRESRYIYPVIDADRNLVGVVSLSALKDILPNRDTWDWIVAADVLETVHDQVYTSTPLREALDLLNDLGIEQMPVLLSDNNLRPVGIIDRRKARRRVQEELLRRRGMDPAAGTVGGAVG